MEFKRSRLAELAEVETRAASLSQEVVKAAQGARIQRLVAPIDGAVQQLVVHTVGRGGDARAIAHGDRP